MWRNVILGLSLVGLAAIPAAANLTVPEPVNGVYSSTLLATDRSGNVFCFDGDTVYGLSGGAFAPLVSGIGAAAGAWVDPSGFAVNAAGTMAYVATGYSGRLVEVDLSATTSRELPGARLGSNYGVAVDPIYGKVFVTDSYTQNVYLVDPSGSGLLTQLKDFSGLAMFGSGITFAPDGRMIVPVARSFAAWPDDDNFQLDIYEASRAFLDGVAAGQVPTEGWQVLAGGITVSGSGVVSADAAGNIYVLAADAIYRVDPAGNPSVFAGDPSINVFDADRAGVGHMGIAYDTTTDEVLYAQRDSVSAAWGFQSQPAPEPATLALLLGGAAMALARRRKGGR